MVLTRLQFLKKEQFFHWYQTSHKMTKLPPKYWTLINDVNGTAKCVSVISEVATDMFQTNRLDYILTW